ncbi:hypothetical protein NliqN6_3079 [Naganishia liquefaciens]|uniref:50S ribosomal protein L35 n=1 Tax=Naganishia liquefaciens TaxID=104408 RepID=A0A8H3TT50_9TREE|nr:hypothetical protein NliqN6_3079 [Naganishia liquefaciens]
MFTILSRTFLSARAFAKSPAQVMTFSTTPVVEKMKTHQGAAKRWKAIASGNFKRAQAGKQHLNSSFSSHRISTLRQTVYSTKTQRKTLRKLLPNA